MNKTHCVVLGYGQWLYVDKNIENIEGNNLSHQTFTGYLDLKDGVRGVIQTIIESTSFELSIKNDKITIKKNLK